MNEYVVETL